MKKLFSTRRNKVTKKFWKFVNEDGCSPGVCVTIKYTPGETVEVKYADPNPEIQCASGIHCIDFSDEKYNSRNIVFGPKVAILEVDEKDIIYYKKGGKCRVKKAKVLEVKEPEIWMRTGNNNSFWALTCAYHCGHHPDVMQVIIDNKDGNDAYYYAKNVLKGHDERLMQVIIDSQSLGYAYNYALLISGHDEKLMQVILDIQNSEYAYCYAKSILKRHDERLMQVIIDNQDAKYAYHYAKNILQEHNEKLMNIIENDSYYKNLYEENILNKEPNND